jgi:hypothetical protein
LRSPRTVEGVRACLAGCASVGAANRARCALADRASAEIFEALFAKVPEPTAEVLGALGRCNTSVLAKAV